MVQHGKGFFEMTDNLLGLLSNARVNAERKRNNGSVARRNRKIAREWLQRMSLTSRIRFVIWGI
jgi:hypothetical protein